MEDRCLCGHKRESHLMRYTDHQNYIYKDLPEESCRDCYWEEIKKADHSGMTQAEISQLVRCRKFEPMDNLQFMIWKSEHPE